MYHLYIYHLSGAWAASPLRDVYPQPLRAVTQGSALSDAGALAQWLREYLALAPLQTTRDIELFGELLHSGIGLWLYRRDLSTLREGIAVAQRRMEAARAVQPEAPYSAWTFLMQLAEAALLRLLRHSSRAAFEAQLDQAPWDALDAATVSKLAWVAAYTYLFESDPDAAGKCRPWLRQAAADSPVAATLALAWHSATTGQAPDGGWDLLRARLLQGAGTPLAEAALAELTLLAPGGALPPAAPERLPRFVQPVLAARSAALRAREGQTGAALELLEQAQQLAAEDESANLYLRLLRGTIQAGAGPAKIEKELRDLAQLFRQREDLPRYAEALQAYFQLLRHNDSAAKAAEPLLNLLRLVQKYPGHGGAYLLARALELCAAQLVPETEKPGISWMLAHLEGIFSQIEAGIEGIIAQAEAPELSVLRRIRAAYMALEPVSKCHIKVYFRYQHLTLRVMMLEGDSQAAQLAAMLSRELNQPHNPLHFIRATWRSFEEVPDTVLYQTLNRAIDIAKGDLALAAAHVDFSYRNLRNYISLKKVNRLGFFLEQQHSRNRQLELGIRYLFFDMYRNNTLFEAVYDMPRFLLQHVKTGFYAEALESHLNIKATTAKKYIRAMLDAGMLIVDKTAGRRHKYQLDTRAIVKRLAKEQLTQIGPDE